MFSKTHRFVRDSAKLSIATVSRVRAKLIRRDALEGSSIRLMAPATVAHDLSTTNSKPSEDTKVT